MYVTSYIYREICSLAVEIITPSDPNQRGCQLSLKFSCDYPVEEVNKKLLWQGVVVRLQIALLNVATVCCMYIP